jgi:hypothetical protein
MTRLNLSTLVLLSLLACNGDDPTTVVTEADADTDADADADADTDADTDTDVETAQVRVIHLSPDAPDVDVFVEDVLSGITNLPFGDGTEYVDLPVGTTNFKVGATGTPVGQAVLDFDVDLMAGMSYSAVAYDDLASIKALPLVDSTDGLAAGEVRLQISHVAAGVGQVDIWDLAGPTEIAPDLDFGATTSIDVPEGALELGIDTDDDAVPDVTFSVPSLGADQLVNVFAVADANGVFLHAQLPDGTEARVDANPPVGDARVRVLHLSSDAPNVDVWVDDTLSGLTDLPYLECTPYVTLDAVTTDFDVTATGAALNTSVLGFSLDLMDGMDYTAVAYGPLASIMALPLTDDATGIPAGNTRLQISHVADGVGQVDILNVDTGAVVVPDVDFGATASIDLPDGAYRLGLDTDDDGAADFAFDVPALGPDQLVDVFAINDTDGPALFAVFDDSSTVRVDALEPARLRVTHASPDAPAVDVFLDDVLSAKTNLAFEGGTAYVDLWPGTYNVKVAPTGQPATAAVIDADLTFDAGMAYSVVAYSASDAVTALQLTDDDMGIPAGETRLQVTHVADGVGEVDIWNMSATPPVALLPDVAFGATGTVSYPAGPLSIGLDTNNDGTPEHVFDLPDLGADAQVNGFAVLDGLGAPFILAHLPNGTTARVDATVVPPPVP